MGGEGRSTFPLNEENTKCVANWMSQGEKKD